MNLEIRYANAGDLSYIDHLQKKNAEELAFYPKAVFEREISNQRILLALVNNQHAGYLYHGAMGLDKVNKIHQACIEYDLRGQWYGAGLVNQLEAMNKIVSSDGLSLRCGSDIAANQFWQRMGFSCIDIQHGGVRRMRDINVWYKSISEGLFSVDHIEPSTKKKDASIWTKRKNKSQSSMLRGKALLDYRNAILSEHGEISGNGSGNHGNDGTKKGVDAPHF